MIKRIEELYLVLKQPAYLEILKKVISDTDDAFSNFTQFFATFEDLVFKTIALRYTNKKDELLYEVINRINNFLLRRLSQLIWPSNASEVDSAQRDSKDTFLNAKID